MTETYTTSELIDLVNRLRKENEELRIEIMAMRGAANSLKLHNGLLESERRMNFMMYAKELCCTYQDQVTMLSHQLKQEFNNTPPCELTDKKLNIHLRLKTLNEELELLYRDIDLLD